MIQVKPAADHLPKSSNLLLTMTKSHNENVIGDKTLEIKAGKAKAPELALHLEELNKKNQKKTIRQAKNNLEKQRILLLH